MIFFFFNDTATTEIYTLSLHDALPISVLRWPNGAILNFTVSSDAALCQTLHVLASNGWAKLDVPVNPPGITHAHWSTGGLEKGTKVSFPKCN